MTDTADSPAPGRVALRRLRLTNFRNYPALTCDFGTGHVVLTGDNGAGKTNLLEAVSLLSPGRGLRRAPYGNVASAGQEDGFAVHAWLEGPYGEAEIGTGTYGNGEGTNRQVRIDGSAARNADAMAEFVRVIWLTPAMDGLFSGPAGDRRRFLDRLVLGIDPGHGRRTLDYEKATRSRNRLLQEHAPDPVWLDGLEAQMAETGVAIAAARLECVKLLQAIIARQDTASPFPQAEIALDGVIETQCAERASVDVEEDFRARLSANRDRDRAAGRSLEGPHRTDILVRHVPKAMAAALCSTGEQKALLVGLILADARLTAELSSMAPILLLDEIAAHLDAHRRGALFDILDDLNGQAFMTGTDAALFSALGARAQFLGVDSGTVKAMPEPSGQD